jgi:hypothetical protein
MPTWLPDGQQDFHVSTHDRRLSRWFEEISIYGGSGISGLQRESPYQRRLCATRTRWRNSMTKCTLLGVAAILSTTIATPVLAQAIIQEPGGYAVYHPGGDLGIGSTPSQRRDVVGVGRGTADAMASAPSVRSSTKGNETTTRPWSAPVGHRQPRAADVPTSRSVSPQILDEEDANVDRKIRSVCRRC